MSDALRVDVDPALSSAGSLTGSAEDVSADAGSAAGASVAGPSSMIGLAIGVGNVAATTADSVDAGEVAVVGGLDGAKSTVTVGNYAGRDSANAAALSRPR